MKINKFKISIFIFIIFISFIFYLGYNMKSGKISGVKSDSSFRSLNEATKPGSFKMTFTDFYGSEIRLFNVSKGDKIEISYNSTVKNSPLTIDIKDPFGNIASSIPINKKGSIKITANATGKISIAITGSNTSGSLKISWKRILFKIL
jgi:hypothetical protein